MRHRSILGFALAALGFSAVHGCSSDSAPQQGGSSSGGNPDAGDGASPTRAVPSFNGAPQAVLALGDSLFVGGSFTAINAQSAKNALALTPVGATATPCSLEKAFDGTVTGFASNTTALFAVGSFTHVGTQSAKYVAKINLATCALDTTFSPELVNGFDAPARTLLLTDNALYVGGDFTAYRGTPSSANRIAKLDLVSGTIDPAFNRVGATTNGFSTGFVSALARVGSDLYIGGSFSSYRGAANNARNFAKVETTNGILDTTFTQQSSGFDQPVNAVFATDQNVYVGGEFSTYRGAAIGHVARLDVTGAADTQFSPATNGTDGAVHALYLSGNTLFIGGRFATYRGAAHANLVKVNVTTGAADATFSPVGQEGFDDAVRVIAPSDAGLFVGGDFESYRGKPVGGLAKISAADGAPDAAFTYGGASFHGFNGSVRAVSASATTLFVGGDFDAYGGVRVRALAKLDAKTFAIDTAFHAADNDGFDGAVTSLAASGGSLYVGGRFTRYRGVANAASHLAKIDPATGALDATFSPPGAGANGFEGDVLALAADDSAVYVGGGFTSYRGAIGTARALAKLNPQSGALDSAFSPPMANGFNAVFGAEVRALLLSGASLYVGGAFTDYRTVGGSARNLAKLDTATGALDATFVGSGANGVDGTVQALALAGTSLYIGGAFTEYRGTANAAQRIAKIDAASGALDSAFSPAASNGFDGDVSALLMNEGSLYVGGAFTAYRGAPDSAKGLAKLNAENGTLDGAFAPPTGTAGVTGVNVFAFAAPTLCIGGSFSAYRATPAQGFVCVDPRSGTKP